MDQAGEHRTRDHLLVQTATGRFLDEILFYFLAETLAAMEYNINTLPDTANRDETDMLYSSSFPLLLNLKLIKPTYN